MIYKSQWLLIALFIPFSFAHTLYTIWRWFRSGDIMPLLLCPLIFIGRLSYALGMVDGKISNTFSKDSYQFRHQKKTSSASTSSIFNGNSNKKKERVQLI
jgi:hypothetical protein